MSACYDVHFTKKEWPEPPSRLVIGNLRNVAKRRSTLMRSPSPISSAHPLAIFLVLTEYNEIF